MSARSTGAAYILLLASVGFCLASGSVVEDCSAGDTCSDEEVGLAQLRLQRKPAQVAASVECAAQGELEASLFQGKEASPDRITFKSNSPEFDKLTLGSKVRAIADGPHAFAHEAPVYLKDHDWVSFSSNQLSCANDLPPDQCWKIPAVGKDRFTELSYINLKTGKVTNLPNKVWQKDIVQANGAYPIDGENIWVTSQGIGESKAGVYSLNVKTGETQPVITESSFMGSPFNSPNDVVKDPLTGALLFTDPIYGWEQGFRPTPQLGNWLWMYPMTNKSKEERPHDLRMVADGFMRPNGACFASEKGDVLYVSDTGYFYGNDNISPVKLQEAIQDDKLMNLNAAGLKAVTDSVDPLGPRTVYAYDVRRDEDQNIVGLSGRRVVAISDNGIPDGIKVDCEGRIYTGQNNGIGIFSPGGQQLGVIEIKGGTSNMVLVPRGCRTQLVMMGETTVYSVFLNTKTCVVAR